MISRGKFGQARKAPLSLLDQTCPWRSQEHILVSRESGAFPLTKTHTWESLETGLDKQGKLYFPHLLRWSLEISGVKLVK